MNYQDFEFIANLVTERSGIEMKSDKAFILEGRLAPLARREGLISIEDLVHVMRSRKEERLLSSLVDALLSNETSFFRGREVFRHLREKVLPELARARKGSRVRVLCAGCSTGQEAYSLAMMLEQAPELTGGVPVEILGVDISDRCLERARQGLFTQFEVQRGLPIRMLMQYFTQQDEHWRLSELIRSRVSFRKQNLLQPMSELGQFDLVLCRNVVSSFKPEIAREVINRVSLQVNSDGYLLFGEAEEMVAPGSGFRPSAGVGGVFRLTAAAEHAA